MNYSAVQSNSKSNTVAGPAPLISAVIATYNEESYVGACLDGLLHQVELPGPIEIIVIDGGSTDRTLDIVRNLATAYGNIRIVPNPRRFQVFAWNIGIREARGQYIAYFSAHTEYSRDYLARCYEARLRTGAANVGGVQLPVGRGVIGRAIAQAMQSPFGVGNAQHRYATKEQFVDSVFGAFFDKALLVELGGYNESIPFSEDCEFNYRVRKAGHTIFMSPTIRVRYHARSTLSGLAHQMLRYGFWRRRTQLEHPEFVPWRVLAPPMLILAMILSVVTFAETRNLLALVVPFAYACFISAAIINALRKGKRPLDALALILVLPVMHFSYGAGWLAGFLLHRRRASTLNAATLMQST